MTYQPLHHKYRPQTFSDLVGQEAIATTLTNALHQQRIAPAYLFTGARGTGKTSSARILAKSLNCLKYEKPTEQPCGQCEVCQSIAKGSALDVIEIDAASNTGVDNIRELIERSQFAPVQCRYKVYVVDECHMLSTAAFNALLKTLEEPPDRVVFVLATTDPQRVLPTIISRCQRFDFRRIPLDAIVKHLGVIATKEAIPITDDAMTLVAQISQGGLRDAESLLDQLSLLAGEVTVDHVWDLVGSVPERDLMALLDAIAQDNPEILLDSVRRLMDRGREPLTVLQNLASFYRDLLIAKTAPARNDLVALTPPTWAALCQFAQNLDLATILAGQQQLRSSEDQIKSTTQARLWLEVTLMGLLPSAVRGGMRQNTENSHAVMSSISESRVSHSATPTNAATSPSTLAPPSNSDVAKIDAAIVPSEEGAIVEPTLPSLQTTPASLSVSAVDATAAMANPADGSDIDERNQTWQRLLSCVDLTGTRAMLSVNCYLLHQNEHEILVGIKSQSMLKMITGMLPQLEKACVKAFKSKVKVNLQVAEAAPQEASPGKPEATESSDRAPSFEPDSLSAFDDQSASTAPTRNFEVKEETAPFSTAETSQPLYLANQSPTPPVTTTNWSTDPVMPVPSNDPWQQEDEVTRAAKQLADFFGGRVVDMTDSDTVAATPELAEINAASLQEKASTVLQDTEAELDGDDDVPF